MKNTECYNHLIIAASWNSNLMNTASVVVLDFLNLSQYAYYVYVL